MRNVEYITNGFGAPTQVMPVPAYVMPNPPQSSNMTQLDQRLYQDIIAGKGVSQSSGGRWSDFFNPTGPLAYKFFSPSGGGIAPTGSYYDNPLEKFGRMMGDLTPLGHNSKFIDIVRGPSGRTYLTQAIRFLQAFRQVATARPNMTLGAAYNTASMQVGTSSPVTPSRTFIQNVMTRLGINGIDRMIGFYNEILSSL
jgi:hypothetical protein